MAHAKRVRVAEWRQEIVSESARKRRRGDSRVSDTDDDDAGTGTESEGESEGKDYVVEAILDGRGEADARSYLIKWRPRTRPRTRTWEPVSVAMHPYKSCSTPARLARPVPAMRSSPCSGHAMRASAESEA